ncbi:MAG: hypothetical protein JWL77_5631 [Chthonomonadaceae bacterium]|nr:hypothetical protein [Chthonomonadaceae bacterium]
MSIGRLRTVPVILCVVSLGAIANADDTATKKSLHSEPMKTDMVGEAQDREGYRLAFSFCHQSDWAPRTPQEANKLERRLKQHPNDFDARERLIDYYTRVAPKTQATHTARVRHVLWIIQNQPASDFSRDANLNLIPGAGIGEDDQQKAARIWKKQVSAHPRNARIIWNASNFFEVAELDYCIELLTQGQTLDPKDWRWPSKLASEYEYRMYQESGKQRHETAEKALASFERWYRVTSTVHENNSILPMLGESAFEAEEMDKARQYATKILRLSAQYDPDKQAAAIYQGNWLLGRLAVKSGDLEKAKSYLLASGRVSGSQGLKALGPNMRLAKELLEKGEQQTVLDYFALCAEYWKNPKLKQWTEEVKAGKIPDFGFNLDNEL